MHRLLALGLVAVALGCNAPQAPPIDPFIGPSRIAPPATGGAAPSQYYPSATPISPSPAGPYSAPVYTPGTPTYPQSSFSPGSMQGSSASATLLGQSTIAPPGLGAARRLTADTLAATPTTKPEQSTAASPAASSIAIKSIGTQAIASKPATDRDHAVVLASAEEPLQTSPARSAPKRSDGSEIRIVENPGAAQPTASAGEPELFTPVNSRPLSAATSSATSNARGVADGSIRIPEITELPSAKRSSAATKVVQASAVAPLSETAKTKPATTGNRDKYGYDGDYRWLQGRLEYSNIDQQWKLRYIPIDGDTDDHGGSVVLSDASLLGSYASGDFVFVEGQIGDQTKGQGSFAPHYRVRSIKRAG